jgi:transcription initiation factor TFIID subunit 9B
MATNVAASQTNGVPASSAGSNSQTLTNTQTTTIVPTASSQPNQQQPQPPLSPSTAATRPRDARMIELLLMSQGVTSYEARVPLLLLDLAYRHTSSVLSDALHLSADPYITQAGSKSASSAAAALAAAGGDATVSPGAVRLAIAARLGYQFRGGGGASGMSKEWMQELARERNKVALPKVAPNEWGSRLPSERFVLSGVSWGLKDVWAEAGNDGDDGDDDEDDEDEEMAEGTEAPAKAEDVGGDGVEGGTVADVFGEEIDEDMEMEE